MTNLTTRAVPETSAPTRTPTGIGRRLLWLGPTGIIVATALSVVEWFLVRGPENEGSIAAAALALLMTAPAVLARRWPLLAVSVVTVAAVANGLLFPDLVRCGGAFPALLYITFAVGAHEREGGRGWGRPVAGLGIAVAATFAQYAWDPALHADATFLWFGPGLVLIAWAVGIGWSALVQHRRSLATGPVG